MKLIYFPAAGRAETARLILAAAGAEYEFDKIEGGTWPQRKAELSAAGMCKFGQVPALKDGDLVICQSTAITRYLAGKYNFAGADLAERATADMFHMGVIDLFEHLIKIQFYTAEADRPAAFEKFGKEVLPGHLTNLGNLVKGPYVLGDHLSYADIALFDVLSHLKKANPGVIDAFPKVGAVYTAVAANEGIAKYVASKPYGDAHY